MLNRGYSILTLKSVDADARLIRGVATTPTTDRMGDIVEPLGIKFKNPLPLLLFHDHTRPVGVVKFDKPTTDGVTFEASIPDITEPGALRDRVNEAWQSVQAGLIKGVSIGFRVLEDGIELLRTGGVRFSKTEVLELSLVSVPANADATIHNIKSFDAPHLAASGMGAGVRSPKSGASDITRVVSLTAPKVRDAMTNIAEQIASSEAKRAATAARMTAIMQKAADEGTTLDASQKEDYDTAKAEIGELDEHIVRLRDLDATNKAAAVPVVPVPVAGTRVAQPGIVVLKQTLPPGIRFARSVMCQVQARLDNHNVLDVAKSRFPADQDLHQFLQVRAAVPAGTTTNDPWASPLVDPTNLAGEFIEFLRPKTIIGQFGTNGIPSLRRVPFNVRITGQNSGGVANWVGQGRAKPVTSFGYEAITLLYTKIAAIAVITEELARFSTPSAEQLVRDALAGAVIERMDIDFIDPAQAAVSGVNPASITNGLVALSSAGTSADNVRTDLVSLLSEFVDANQDPSGLVLILPSSLALALSIMTNSLGQAEFPNVGMSGGSVKGIPVIASQYAANASGSGNLVIAVNANEVFLADDGQVRVDASREASLEMTDAPAGRSDTPTASSVSVVSMYQTNSIALRAERFINWAKRRPTAVVYMDDVNWGSVGSPS